MIISADDTVDEAASGGQDSAIKCVVNAVSSSWLLCLLYIPCCDLESLLMQADYMVSFMDYVDPSNKMLQCHLEMKIRGVKRPIGDSFFS